MQPDFNFEERKISTVFKFTNLLAKDDQSHLNKEEVNFPLILKLKLSILS